MSTRCLLNICWVFRERCGGTKAYSCLQVSLRQILKLLILWAQKTADRELTAYVSGFEEEIITDMVMDWLDILSSAFSLQSPSASTVSRDSSFMRKAGKIRKLVLREGRWLAQDHTACTCGFRVRSLLWCVLGEDTFYHVSLCVAKAMAPACPVAIAWGWVSQAHVTGNVTGTGPR